MKHVRNFDLQLDSPQRGVLLQNKPSELFAAPEDPVAQVYQISSKKTSESLTRMDRVQLALIGVGVIFAALGAGEAVYRLAFFQFDGATDRLPIEMLFGVAFAWLTVKLVKDIYRSRTETSARINLVWHRNAKIRNAVDAIGPAIPANQQAIRVIREEVDSIEWALSDILPDRTA